jgi:Tol biopolymer transport system component
MPSRQGRYAGASLLTALLAFAVFFSVGSASAAAPTVVIGTATNPTYTTVDISGELDAGGEESNWNIQYSSDGGTNWNYSNLGGQSFGTAPEQIPPGGGTIEGLRAGTTYVARIHVERFVNGPEEFNSDPSSPFTTESLPAQTVTIDPVTGQSATSAEFSGHIEPNAPAGEPSVSEVRWHFHCEPIACPDAEAEGQPAVPAGSAGADVHAESSELEPNTEYEVTLVTENLGGDQVTAGPVPFKTGGAAPIVQTLPAFAIRGGTEALVGGSINPRNSDTSYWIEWGPTDTYGQKFPATPVDIGAGGRPQYVTQRLAGLSPSSEYHFRLVGENSVGPPHDGVDQSFETVPASEAVEQNCPNAQLRIENNSTALPECRAYEQVTPVDKNGFDVGNVEPLLGQTEIAGEDGSRIAFESLGAFADSRSSLQLNPNISDRTPAGWTTRGLGVPVPPQPGPEAMRSQWYSPDLAKVVLTPPPGYHLAPGDLPGERNIYLRDTATDSLTTLNADSRPTGNNSFEMIGASSDGAVVFFSCNVPLLDGVPATNPETGTQVGGIYEWRNGALDFASVLPDGDPSLASGGGTEPSGNIHVSRDGSRMMFKGGPGAEGDQLVLREDGTSYPITPAGEPLAFFVGATPSLSAIFFTSPSALTPEAAENGLQKLYRYNSGPKTLTLISPDASDGGNAVSVRGSSPDGSYVYFRSDSQYLPGQGLRGQSGVATNLYLWHDDAISFIAAEHEPPSDEALYTTFRVSPDGKFASFQSSDRLTAYDNTDATPGPGGGPRADSEVYVYDAEAGRLTCVSCNPSGRPPSGTPEGTDAGSSFPSPPNRQLLNRQVGVGDDGQIFFNSRDSLVSADVDGVSDVYEWRDGQAHLISSGTGTQPSFYSAASLGGGDVFFSTRQPLISSDRDQLGDIYDARVEGGFPTLDHSSLCEGSDSCRGAESNAPAVPAPRTESSAPEVTPSPARLRLKKALRACKRRPHKERAHCRAAAKKKFKKASNGRSH